MAPPEARERFDLEFTVREAESCRNVNIPAVTMVRNIPAVTMVRMTEKQTPQKLLERSDVHQLAEVLEACLAEIWDKGTDQGQMDKAREAIEICMHELSKQVSVQVPFKS